ncbi:putative chaperone DnaJ [Rosa chinensis]|uniref:Putative chaperone DnaJ n=1 Tax=Rosa chinensis TaxID=74649 RepID=A0A2P6PEE2_ROSCH|nr:dnaJ homolog subfamily B member 5 [Rosa chinensis]PRQ20292.1 putative chaperone DnaJ [Rosa chinensis]
MAKKGEKQPQASKRKRNPRTKEKPDASFISSTTMEIDHYKILGVNRNASPDEVKKAYRKLVMFWHPDKHLQEEARAKAEAKFKEINQAYQILNDPVKRHNYDNQHANIANSNRTASSFSFPPSKDENTFATVFGFGSRRTDSMVYSPLECSLEELYQGTTKKMKVTRAVTNALGEETMVEQPLTVNIKPGFRHGTNITYKVEANTADVGFVIKEKQHSVYERHGNDLIVHQEITLLEALTGGRTLDLTTLNGRKLMVPLPDDVIRAPGDEMVVPGEGMPISSQPGVKGNLRIKFNVKFPSSSLTAEQKLDLKRGLGGVPF